MGTGLAGPRDGGAREGVFDMKVQPKPFNTHRDVPAIKGLVETPPDTAKNVAYEQLVTRQNVAPEKARQLLGLPQK